ncbi:MAG: toll/interleukin-1 receptor domain-containing protein [Armatimonadota bacterium]
MKSHPFRIFISYSHEDIDKAERVHQIIEEMGLEPLWDDHIRPGMPFTDQVKGMIAHEETERVVHAARHHPVSGGFEEADDSAFKFTCASSRGSGTCGGPSIMIGLM